MKLPGWTREPLVHFLVAGALVFAFFALRGNEVDPASRVIDVDRETQAQIALGFERMMSRPPTDAELAGLIENYVHDEVLYREAIRLGFDRDDAIVRRRLAQKIHGLEHLLDDQDLRELALDEDEADDPIDYDVDMQDLIDLVAELEGRESGETQEEA